MQLEPEACLHHLVVAAARSRPDAAAIHFNGQDVSYAELMHRASRLESSLRKRAIGEGSIVGLYLPRSPDLIAAQLAVLMTGAAYLPLDRSYPSERNRFMLADTRPGLVMTLRAYAGEMESLNHTLLIDVDDTGVQDPPDHRASGCHPDSLAYVIYTSGSTGKPKGTLNHHRGPVNYIAHMVSARRLAPGERVLQFTSLSFDGSVRDTLGTLAFGGTILLLDETQARDPLALLAAIRDQGANLILCIVPTMLRALARGALREGAGCHALRLIMVGGETLLRSDVEVARLAFGSGLQIVNQYGATECSMVAADYPIPAKLPDGPAALPIGRPIPNCRIDILDRDLKPVNPGAEGEVWIGGVGVGRGYLNRPEMTAERFLHEPHESRRGRMYRTGDLARFLPDGSIQYLGRADRQVKVSGHRVELGEIESILREHPGVRETAVKLLLNSGQERLAAYVVMQGAAQISELRAFLAARVPFAMVPAAFVEMDALPLTTSGKIDLERLPRPNRSIQEKPLRPGRNPVESRLVSIWESVLGVEGIGVGDGFFDLGGDSLTAALLLTRIEEAFGRAFEPQVLFESATVEALAKRLENEGNLPTPGVVPLQPLGARNPLFLVSTYLYLREFALGFTPDRPVYGLGAAAPFTRPIEEEALVHYRSLVAFRPNGPYLLIGHSAGGYIALEIARLLIRNGRQVEFLGLVDTFPPGRRRNAVLIQRVRIHLENLRGKNARQAVDYLAGSTQRMALRALRYAPGRRRLVGAFVKAGAELSAQDIVVQNYSPESFPGDLTLFVARDRPRYVRWDPMRSWSCYLTGRLTVVPIEGTHLSAIRDPRASSLTRTVDAMLP